ncbi:shisa-5-like, partial [Asbolus verrucosus]
AGTNVTVTTQPISASPVVVPPYPVEARHPTPQTGPYPVGFTSHNPPYPTHNPHPVGAAAAPYPPVSAATPYPPAGPPVSTATPYPPTGPPAGISAPYPDYSTNPPSYSEAVGQPAVQSLPSAKEGYSKQSPYNPNY